MMLRALECDQSGLISIHIPVSETEKIYEMSCHLIVIIIADRKRSIHMLFLGFASLREQGHKVHTVSGCRNEISHFYICSNGIVQKWDDDWNVAKEKQMFLSNVLDQVLNWKPTKCMPIFLSYGNVWWMPEINKFWR